ncbi:hypothetical protein AB6A40_010091 [Gnathostoma spinigerum]|uniref:Uncharacterized protein n=1 Tax=Gnathostoma spinigerum TaxID=75299 RepID=A0ABD6EW94_9BILA
MEKSSCFPMTLFPLLICLLIIMVSSPTYAILGLLHSLIHPHYHIVPHGDHVDAIPHYGPHYGGWGGYGGYGGYGHPYGGYGGYGGYYGR